MNRFNLKTNRIKAMGIICGVWGLVYAASSWAGATGETPLVLLVNGANFSPKGWTGLRAALAERKIASEAVELYKADEKVNLEVVSQRLCSKIKELGKGHSVVLVGHSQGGAIITETAAACASPVNKLIYVAAVLPNPGKNIFADLSAADGQNYEKCGKLEAGVWKLKNFEGCWKVFMGDVTDQKTASRYFKDYMVNEPGGIGDSSASAESLKRTEKIPKFYIQTEKDQIISLDTQKVFVKRADFKKVALIKKSSHTPFFDKKEILAELIAQFVR